MPINAIPYAIQRAVPHSIPDGYGSVNAWTLNFTDGYLPPYFTFTRATTGTYFDSTGTLSTAADNVARFDYDPVTLQPNGLLIEGSDTNYFLYSNSFTTGWTLSNGTIETVSSQGVDGNNGFKFVPSASNAIHRMYQAVSGPTVGKKVTLSVHVKASGINYIMINSGAALGGGVAVSLVDGTYITNGTVTNVSTTRLATGYYRIKFTGTYAANTNIYVNANNSLSYADQTFTSDGTSGFYIGAIQLSVSDSSYIPTTSTAVTRAADSVVLSTLSNIGWAYGSGAIIVHSEVVSQTEPVTSSTPFSIVSIDDTTSSNRLQLRRDNGTNTPLGSVAFRFVANGTSVLSTIVGDNTYPLETFKKIGISYSTSGVSCSYGGTLGTGSSTTWTSFRPTRMTIGTPAPADAAGAVASVHVKSIIYYPSQITDAQLQAMTT